MKAAPLVVRLVSPHQLIRLGVEAMLAPHLSRVDLLPSTAEPGDRPDVVVLDTDGLPDAMLACLIRSAVTRNPAAAVVTFTQDPNTEQQQVARTAGAVACLSAALDGEALVSALEDVVARATAVPAGGGDEPTPRRFSGPCGLSERELQILIGIASGLTNDQVASRTYLSINTVKSYVRSSYRKIGVTSRSRAILWAVDHGLAFEGLASFAAVLPSRDRRSP